jgi:5-methylcytosine-specific restriction protein A
MKLLHCEINKKTESSFQIEIDLINQNIGRVVVAKKNIYFSKFLELREQDLVLFTSKKKVKTVNEVTKNSLDSELIIDFKTLHKVEVGIESFSDLPKNFLSSIENQKSCLIDMDELGITKDDILSSLEIIPPYSIKQSANLSKRKRQDLPIVGERFSGRKEIWENFGGQWQQGIGRFSNDPVINVYSDQNGPYPDLIDLENGVIEYRGQGLGPVQALTFGNKLLEQARLEKEPVRFWHKALNNPWEFKTWAIVADRTQINELDKKGNSVNRILWFMVPVEGQNKNSWNIAAKKLEILSLPEVVDDPALNENNLLKKYWLLSEKYSESTNRIKIKEKSVRTYIRRREIRELVLARANNVCEFTGCTGMPPDIGKDGRALLQVDHIVDLALGGDDIPSNMIAVCPNCHYAKTHGNNSQKLINAFKEIVLNKEIELQNIL